MKRYLLNSAVVTAPGEYRYRLVTEVEARAWYASAPTPVSAIGYPETARALGAILGAEVSVNRQQIQMAPGDSALVFRLVFPSGTPRLSVSAKGVVDLAFIRAHCEIGILERVQ